MSSKAEFQFVYIPHDSTRQLEQWNEVVAEGREVECLLDRLKHHFQKMHPSMSETQKRKHKEELKRQRGIEEEGQRVEQLLEAATTMQLVESIALLPPMKKHECIGVTMYVDDSGVFKDLPINARATDIAHSCGMLEIRILGDAFIARVKENDDEFERMDFLISEVSSSSQWMKDSKRHYDSKKNQPPAEEVLRNLRNKTPIIEEITPADEARQDGNTAYKTGKYSEAIEAYTRWLEHDSQSAVAYSNRAMAYLQLKDYQAALRDANAAIELDTTLVKALYRRGVALQGLDRKDEAIDAFKAVLHQQPNNKAAAEKLGELQLFVS